jgi:hypothetical protein
LFLKTYTGVLRSAGVRFSAQKFSRADFSDKISVFNDDLSAGQNGFRHAFYSFSLKVGGGASASFKSSALVVPPNNISRCACTSTPPGITT